MQNGGMTSSISDAALARILAERLPSGPDIVEAGARRRAEYSGDASLYRVTPRVVVFPRTEDDVVAVVDVARDHHVPLTMRGAGTSIAGNAVGPGIVLDTSRHFNEILAVDPDTCTAVVRPGATIAALQAAAGRFGLRFGPDPSTWTRCTLGGAIGNNACGPHALSYGKTADQVVSLDVVDGRGRRLMAARGLNDVPAVRNLVRDHLAVIRTEFGRFGRQVSGYALERLLPERREELGAFLAGTEGTLAVILSATVRLQRVPSSPHLVVLGYPDMAAAADDVPALLPHRPLALEGMDARLVEVVKRAKGQDAVPDLPDGGGWLFVEMGGDDGAEARRRAEALVADAATSSARVLPPGEEARALWRIRADGAGLGGRTPSGQQGWANWEDAAVPPERLGSYLREFESLLDECGLEGLPYGHFGDGCVHIRIDFPLGEPGGAAVMRNFMERAARLVAGYGGSFSGEHGDGRARSELLPLLYSPEAIDLFAAVKAEFDPKGILNPGVIVRPRPIDADLRRPSARTVRALNRGFAFREDAGSITDALHRCTGVAKCRADLSASGGFMCPSYRASKDEKDVTRGRARVLEELLQGTFDGKGSGRGRSGLLAPEVWEALDLCLSCKACAADCPAGVDMARYKSEALFRRFVGRIRPASHYALGWLPRWLRLARVAPRMTSAMLKTPIASWALHTFGGVDAHRRLPAVTSMPFGRWLRAEGRHRVRVPDAAKDSSPSRGPVLVWVDSFSAGVDPAGARATIAVLESMGYEVVLPPDACCGLTWITTGQLDGARRRLKRLVGVFAPFAAAGIPILGIEPSCTAVLRSDLLDLLPDDDAASKVSRAVVTLPEIVEAATQDEGDRWLLPDLSSEEFVVQPHCHQYATSGVLAERRVLQRAGARFTELAGCCGLAGNFGMEKGHYEMSVAVAENALLPALREHADASFVADGFSCRTQAAQLADRRGRTLAEVLADASGLSY